MIISAYADVNKANVDKAVLSILLLIALESSFTYSSNNATGAKVQIAEDYFGLRVAGPQPLSANTYSLILKTAAGKAQNGEDLLPTSFAYGWAVLTPV